VTDDATVAGPGCANTSINHSLGFGYGPNAGARHPHVGGSNDYLNLTVTERPIYNRRMLRKVILGFGISLDGYIARRNGGMDYLVMDKEGEALMADFFAKIDTTIMGRKTAAATAEMRKSGEIPEPPGMATYSSLADGSRTNATDSKW
jgi:RibD C-terminal domain